MKPGPRPQPTALRLLHGARVTDVNQAEPIPTTLLPVCPEDEPEDVQEVFRYTVRQLDHMGIASAADVDTLIAYCWAVVNHRNASRVLARSPILVMGPGGGLVQNPALRVQTQQAQLVARLAAEFGLTPSARAGIEVNGGGGEHENPFADADSS